MPDYVAVTLSPVEWLLFLAGFALLGLWLYVHGYSRGKKERK
jgi:hypothetical protein